MKKQRKLNLRKLSIAKLEVTLIKAAIKGGSDFCSTEALNCQTSTKTRPVFPDLPNGPNECDQNYTVVYGPCRTEGSHCD
ncbi:MAG: hypothetical protein AAF611_04250 [Bacteroidota bacterium]